MTEFIILMAAMMSLVALSIDAMLPAFDAMRVDLAVDYPNQIQYVIGFIFIGMTIGQLVAGPVSDAWGRRTILYGGLAIYFIGTLVCYFANTIEIMLAGRLVQGLGVSAPRIAAAAIVRDKFAGRDMARIMSFVMAIFILVPAIAPSVGQAILFFAGWRWIFILYMVAAAALCIWITLRLEETLKPENRVPFDITHLAHGFREVFASRTAMSYMVCMGICFGSLIGYLNSSQQIFQGHFEAGTKFTLYFGMLALTLGIASLVNARIVQKFGMRYICFRSTIAIIIASAIFLALNYTIDIKLWMFMTYAAMLFFCFGLMFGNLNSIAMEPMGHIAGLASAVIGSVSTLVSMLIGAVIGQMYNDTLIPIVSGFLVLNIVSLGVMIFAEKKSAV